MSLAKRLDKLEPFIKEQQLKRLAAGMFQAQICLGLLRCHAALDAQDYSRVEGVLLGCLHEHLQDAFGADWQHYLWLTPMSEAVA